MILTGSINTIANKLQNISVSLGENYNHSYFITFLMFLGESLCLIIYSFEKKINNNENTINNNLPQNQDNRNNTNNGDSDTIIRNNISNEVIIDRNQKPEATPYMLMLPALCDFFGSTIMTIGLTMLAGSTYQMMRGSSIFFTAIFSRIFLKNKLYLHHYIALSIVISGLTLVGAANVIIKPIFPSSCSKGAEESSSIAGYVLVILAQIFVAFQFIIEEKFMKNYTCHPLKAVGWEGVWGSSLFFVVLIIFQNIKCPNPTNSQGSWTTALCTKNDRNEYRLEDTIFALRQLGDNGMLFFYSILFTLSIALFNFVGITVTKIASSAARAVIDSVRTIVIWAFFMMPIIEKCHRENFNWIQLIGFVFLIFGTLIYNEILVIPFAKKPENENAQLLENDEEEALQKKTKNNCLVNEENEKNKNSAPVVI